MQKRYGLGYEYEDLSVAAIARSILGASPELTSVIPVRIEHGIREPSSMAACQYGLFITLSSGKQTILPLCLWMLGSERTPRRFDNKHAANYNRHQWDRQGIHTIEILAKFGDAPVV